MVKSPLNSRTYWWLMADYLNLRRDDWMATEADERREERLLHRAFESLKWYLIRLLVVLFIVQLVVFLAIVKWLD